LCAFVFEGADSTTQPAYLFFGVLTIGKPKRSSATHRKDSCENNKPKLPCFGDFFPPKIIIFRQ
jgi:hypothetical protein